MHLAAYRFVPGERFLFESTGGGGWGNPLERDVAKVLDDVLDEYISVETAREVYGVVIDPKALKLDEPATHALRAKRLQANGNGAAQVENGMVLETSSDTARPEAVRGRILYHRSQLKKMGISACEKSSLFSPSPAGGRGLG